MNWLTQIVLAAALVIPHDMPNINGISTARASVGVAEKTLGVDHPATAMLLRNLALSYEEAGLHNRAETTAKRSLAILEAAFGPSDVSLTPVLNVLTETYAAQGRFTEARRVAMRAVDIGPGAEVHYATALYNAGAVFESMGELENAREYYKRALTARERWLGADHPYVELTRAAFRRTVEGSQRVASASR